MEARMQLETQSESKMTPIGRINQQSGSNLQKTGSGEEEDSSLVVQLGVHSSEHDIDGVNCSCEVDQELADLLQAVLLLYFLTFRQGLQEIGPIRSSVQRRLQERGREAAE